MPRCSIGVRRVRVRITQDLGRNGAFIVLLSVVVAAAIVTGVYSISRAADTAVIHLDVETRGDSSVQRLHVRARARRARRAPWAQLCDERARSCSLTPSWRCFGARALHM
jgi:hypothetical protein